MNTDYKTVRYQSHAGVGTLMLSRPEKRNGMNTEMRRELVQLGDLLATDDTLRCLIVTRDDLSFCAGIDLTEDMAGCDSVYADVLWGPRRRYRSRACQNRRCVAAFRARRAS
jgi:enoyl-CoA hydratase/carnithine racemase